jgi:hypothetical protein
MLDITWDDYEARLKFDITDSRTQLRISTVLNE